MLRNDLYFNREHIQWSSNPHPVDKVHDPTPQAHILILDPPLIYVISYDYFITTLALIFTYFEL